MQSSMNRGFTLIEMLVVLAIITIVLIIVFFSGGGVNANLALREASDDVALAFRKAQIEGLAVLESPKEANEFEIGYGIHFEEGENTSFVYFIDREGPVAEPRDGVYIGDFSCDSGDRECIDTITFDNSVQISGVRGCETSNNCDNVYDQVFNSSNVSGVSVLFDRPRPQASIYEVAAGNSGDTYQSLEITLQATDGTESTVIIGASGEVTIE